MSDRDQLPASPAEYVDLLRRTLADLEREQRAVRAALEWAEKRLARKRLRIVRCAPPNGGAR